MFSSKIARWGGLVIVLLVLGGVLMNSSYLLKKNNNKNIILDSTKNTKATTTTTTTTTPKPDIIEDTVEISRVELEELKISAQSCKVLKHFSIVLIDTGGEVHKQIRQLVGSIHRYHEYELLIYIYGLDLDEAAKGEIHIWRNVEYWDIRSIYQVSTNIDRTEKINAEYWKPVIFKHSAERLGKFVYIQPGFYLSKKLEVDAIDEYLERHGSFYASPACKDNLSSEKYMAIASTFDVAMHGIQFNSYAYKNIYTPLYDCARAHCSPAQMKDLDTDKFISLSDDLKLSVFCQDIEKITTSLVNSPPAESGCYIINREDFILSGTQLPGNPQKSWLAFTPTKDDSGLIKQPDDKRIHIALGVPTTSKGHSQVSENPVLRVLLPSLKNTIAKKGTEEGDKYVYKLYLAIDRGDPVYDKPENQKHFKELVTNMMSEYNFHFQIIRVINSYGWVPMLWNTVFHHSIDDGADYFYQLNDDVGFITPGWTQILIDRLVKNPVRSNFGVTGPTDEGNRSIFTQAFVHRTHHKIFGYFYPYVFKNWYSDDWVSLVYRDNNSYFKDPNQPLVRNQQTFGTRYDVCSANGKENLNKVLQSSKIKIKEYLESHKD